jgi:hypothetical protein
LAALIPSQSGPLVTQIGTDPIWTGRQTDVLLTPAHFLNTTAHETGLTLAELKGSSPTVSVAAYTPRFDPSRKLWYADIELDMSKLPGYWPFIRLAIARYQPKSLIDKARKLDVKLSKVVVADFSALAPGRALTAVRPDPTHVAVTVTGPGSEDARQTRVAFRLETTGSGKVDELDWQPLTGPQGMPTANDYETATVPTKGPQGQLTWQTVLEIPTPRPSPLRLAVDEFELFHADDPGIDVAARLVYADRIPLT